MKVQCTFLAGAINRKLIVSPKSKLIFSNSLCKARYFSTSNSRFQQQENRDDPSLWISSKLNDLKPCVGVTLPELIRDSIRGWENTIAFECVESGVKYTHKEVLKQSRGFAAALLKSDSGFKRGDVVAIMAHNIPEYCAILFGIWDAGLIATPLNPAYTPHEIKMQLQSSNAKGIVTVPQYLPSVQAAKTKLPTLKSIIVVGEAHEGCHTFSEMVKANPMGLQFTKGSQMDTLSEVAILPFSSGTTGLPKGVMLTHSNLATNVLQYNHHTVNTTVPFTPDFQSRMIGVLPFFHSFGLTCVMMTSMWHGAHTMTIPRFTPELFIGLLRRHRPTVLPLVTPIIAFMANYDAVTKADLDYALCIGSGAAPVGPALINRLLEKAGRYVAYQEGFGMTELSPVTHVTSPAFKNTKIGTVGQPLPLTSTKIVDIVTGNTLPRMEKGELCIKGPQVMKGYLNNEEATRNTIDSDGWLRTGDICYYDNDDCLYIVDRLKELIKVKGLQVSPSELEDVLRSHDKVADVAVVGVPDQDSGELPRAYIVPKKNASLSDDDLQSFVKDKVAPFKQLRGGIEFVEAIPKASSGKILRRVLLDEFKKKQEVPNQ